MKRPSTLGLTIVPLALALACSGPTSGSDSTGTASGDTTGSGGATATSNTSSGTLTMSATSSGMAATTSGVASTTVGSGGVGTTTSASGGSTSTGGPGSGGAGSTGAAGTAGGASTGGSASSSVGGAGGSGGTGNQRPARVLLYSFSTLNIPSVPRQLDILEQQLAGWGYEVDRSTDPAAFSDSNLDSYAAVGMINTCFFPFGTDNTTGDTEAQALQRFLEEGGGLFGTHCADVTFQSANPPVLYNQILGGRASASNFEGVSACRRSSEHAAAASLPDTFSYDGNLDNTDFLADDIEVLVRCTWGDAASTDTVVSWVRNQGPGRVFFTSFGKVDSDLTNATLGEPHIIAGLAWVLGL